MSKYWSAYIDGANSVLCLTNLVLFINTGDIVPLAIAMLCGVCGIFGIVTRDRT